MRHREGEYALADPRNPHAFVEAPGSVYIRPATNKERRLFGRKQRFVGMFTDGQLHRPYQSVEEARDELIGTGFNPVRLN